MKILIDADACPVTAITECCAKAHGLPLELFCDTNHVLSSEYAAVHIIGAGADAVDLAVANACRPGDIVVTQDYGLAALILGRGGHPIHQSGLWYTEDNISGMLMDRYVSKKARMASAKNHLKGPKKRTPEDDRCFEESLSRLILSLTENA